MDKSEWRRWSEGIDPATADESEAIAGYASAVIERFGWRTVLTFLSLPGEVDLSRLHLTSPVNFLVTRTPAQGGLTVHRLGGEMETHPFGYKQPAQGEPLADTSMIDGVLVPGVLFDREGGRLGHGKGYYDKLLGSLDHGPFLLGVTLERRVVDRLPMEAFDVRMDGILTEAGFSETTK